MAGGPQQFLGAQPQLESAIKCDTERGAKFMVTTLFDFNETYLFMNEMRKSHLLAPPLHFCVSYPK